MKDTYMTPEMAVIEYYAETPMLTVSGGNTLPGTENGGDSNGGMDADARGHRGSWGDLWD